MENMNELFNIYASKPETVCMYTPWESDEEGQAFGVCSKDSNGLFYCFIVATAGWMNRHEIPADKHYKHLGAYTARFFAKYGLMATA